MKVRCDNCKGKGHVADGVAIVGLTVFGVLLGITERNNPDGITRQRCKSCKGKGYKKI